MSNQRSYEKITLDDLRRLADIARADRQAFFARKPRWSRYSTRILCVALCQGAALHYVDGRNGIKDLDVWTFFSQYPGDPFPYRRHAVRDFGDPKFGRSPSEPNYVGRNVDLLGRSLEYPVDADPVAVLHQYLAHPKTKSAGLLSQKAVVLLEPSHLLGRVAWPAH